MAEALVQTERIVTWRCLDLPRALTG